MLVSASLAAGSLFGYVGYTRPAFATGDPTCEVTLSNPDPSATGTSGTLANCIANLQPGGKITFDEDVKSIQMNSDDPFVIDKSLTIEGNSSLNKQGSSFVGSAYPVFDGQDHSRIFFLDAGTDEEVVLKGITMQYGYSAGNGGAVFLAGENLVLDNVKMSNNESKDDGGAVRGGSTSIIVKDSYFHRNQAGVAGGAIMTGQGPSAYVQVEGSVFFDNESQTSNGGAIFSRLVKTIDGVFSENKADDEGGAIYTGGAGGRGVNSHNSVFTGNTADKGGALSVSSGTFDISNSTFYKNEANTASAMYSDNLILNFSTVYKNYDSSDSSGAAVVISDGGSSLVSNSIISGNLNSDNSAATDLSYSAPFDISDPGYFNFNLLSTDGDLMLEQVNDSEGNFSHLSPSADSPAVGGANPDFDLETVLAFDSELNLTQDQIGTERPVDTPATIGAIQVATVSASPPSFSAPVPTTSPILTLEENKPFSQGEIVVARVSNATRVESVSIGDTEAEIISFEDGLLTFTVPELESGSYSITGVFNSGTVIFDVGLVVDEEISSQSQELNVWTKKISDTEVKVYAKNPIGNGKIQFFVDGKEIAWVRAEDSDDPKLSQAQGAYYLVRTVELTDSKQAIEIFVDGVRAWRAAYTAK